MQLTAIGWNKMWCRQNSNCTLHRPIGNILFTTFHIVLFVFFLLLVDSLDKIIVKTGDVAERFYPALETRPSGGTDGTNYFKCCFKIWQTSGIIACPFDRWGSVPSTACLIWISLILEFIKMQSMLATP